jgi:hypothetical protein
MQKSWKRWPHGSLCVFSSSLRVDEGKKRRKWLNNESGLDENKYDKFVEYDYREQDDDQKEEKEQRQEQEEQ